MSTLDTSAETFRELREAVNERLAARGLPPAPVPSGTSSLEGAGIGPDDIERLKADLAELIKLEGERGFWSGVRVNALFFGLGLAVPPLIEVAKAMAW